MTVIPGTFELIRSGQADRRKKQRRSLVPRLSKWPGFIADPTGDVCVQSRETSSSHGSRMGGTPGIRSSRFYSAETGL